jgi:polyisoprenoid-binding protein YceI
MEVMVRVRTLLIACAASFGLSLPHALAQGTAETQTPAVSPAPVSPPVSPAEPPAEPPAAGRKPLLIEAKHSSVIFFYPHFGLSHPSAKIMGAQGQIIFDRENPVQSSVDVTLDVSTLVTGLPDFDQMLKGAEYFDVARFPTARFVSRSIEVTGDDTANITGDMTIRGITQTVVLATRFNKRAFNPALFKTGVGFSATAVLSRKAFGLGKLEPFVGDDVNLQIEAEAY